MSIEQLYALYQQQERRVCTDTRQIVPEAIFFALKGANFDGNQYALAALAQGAAYAVVSDPAIAAQHQHCILVPDVLATLQALARHHRRQFNIPIIGLTGSNGKTTTKELLARVLEGRYRVHATRGNLNNHIGVPLTLLAMPLDAEVAVIEMGANKPGDIDELCRIAEPSHGFITNIGKAHLEGMGGVEGVKRTKSEIYRFLAERGGLAFVNEDEPFLADLSAPCRKRLFYRAWQGPADDAHEYTVIHRGATPMVAAAFREMDEPEPLYEVRSQLIGAYNFANVMTAIVLGKYFKVPASVIAEQIESYVPKNNRSQIIEQGGLRILLDAYNANPTSMAAAIENLAQQDLRPRTAILGDMFELGEYSQDEHQRMAVLAIEKLDAVLTVGEAFGAIGDLAGRQHFADVGALAEWLKAHPLGEGILLIKGSRGMRLESLLALWLGKALA